MVPYSASAAVVAPIAADGEGEEVGLPVPVTYLWSTDDDSLTGPITHEIILTPICAVGRSVTGTTRVTTVHDA